MKQNNEDAQGVNGWSVNKKLVLHILQETESDVKQIRKRIDKLERLMAVSATQQRMSASVLGAIAGLVPVVIALLLGKL